MEDQESLNAAVKETRAVSEAISNRSFKLKAKNQKLRLRDDVKNEIFWSLVKKQTKKGGGLTF